MPIGWSSTNVLLDTCVWGGARITLKQAGHDTEWSGDWSEDPGDREILAYANRSGRVLVTLDKDFGELAIVHNQPHSGIMRLVNLRAQVQGEMCARVLASHGHLLENGAIITVEADRLRIREGNA